MITAFLNDGNCFLKQVNILIIFFFFSVGWSSQTILVILLNKESSLGFYSGVNITSSFNFFLIFFSLLQLAFCKGWLICWFSNYFNYLVRCSMDDFIFLFKAWINAACCTLTPAVSAPWTVPGFISGRSVTSRDSLSILFPSLVTMELLSMHFPCFPAHFLCARIWCCTTTTSETDKHANQPNSCPASACRDLSGDSQ